MTKLQEDRYQMIAAIARRLGEGRTMVVGNQVDYRSPMAGPGSHFRATVDVVALRAARERCGRCGDTVRRCQCRDFVVIPTAIGDIEFGSARWNARMVGSGVAVE